MQLTAICCTATEPSPVEDLMQACDLHPQEEEMAFDLLKDLTEVILNSVARFCCSREISPVLCMFATLYDTVTRAQASSLFQSRFGLVFRYIGQVDWSTGP